jgi:hypothetical protein
VNNPVGGFVLEIVMGKQTLKVGSIPALNCQPSAASDLI